MDAGLVGLTYSGKSTLFSAMTGLASEPPGSLKPHIGVAPIPDPALDALARFVATKKIVPATLQVVDVPGLVRGASEGKGFGNAFLSHIRQVDALIHVVRAYEGGGVAHVEGSVDPARDIDTVETELIIADLQTVESALPKAEKSARRKDPGAQVRLDVLSTLKPILEDGRPARSISLDTPDERSALKSLGLLSAKRVLYVANVDEDDALGQGPHAGAVRQIAEREGMECQCVCARIESELAELDEADRDEMLEGLGLSEPALSRVARTAYRLLGLQSFYTAGPKEIRAWTIHQGETAPEAAGAVHSDIQRGFIRAEVYSVADMEELCSEKAIREAGRLRVEGKDYVMRDQDVVHFRFNV